MVKDRARGLERACRARCDARDPAAGSGELRGLAHHLRPIPMPTATGVSQPVLVIGGTADALTPYEWATALTEALGKATLLTSQHFGHGGVDLANECVVAHVRAYLTSGSVPVAGTVCQ
jgi:homoserine acetyltransferase